MSSLVNASWLAIPVGKISDSYSFLLKFQWKKVGQFVACEMTAISWTELLHHHQMIIFMLVMAEYFLLPTPDFEFTYTMTA